MALAAGLYFRAPRAPRAGRRGVRGALRGPLPFRARRRGLVRGPARPWFRRPSTVLLALGLPALYFWIRAELGAPGRGALPPLSSAPPRAQFRPPRPLCPAAGVPDGALPRDRDPDRPLPLLRGLRDGGGSPAHAPARARRHRGSPSMAASPSCGQLLRPDRLARSARSRTPMPAAWCAVGSPISGPWRAPGGRRCAHPPGGGGPATTPGSACARPGDGSSWRRRSSSCSWACSTMHADTYMVAPLLLGAASVLVHQGVLYASLAWSAAASSSLALHADFFVPSTLPRDDVVWALLVIWAGLVLAARALRLLPRPSAGAAVLAALVFGQVLYHQPWSQAGLLAVACGAVLAALTPRERPSPRHPRSSPGRPAASGRAGLARLLQPGAIEGEGSAGALHAWPFLVDHRGPVPGRRRRRSTSRMGDEPHAPASAAALPPDARAPRSHRRSPSRRHGWVATRGRSPPAPHYGRPFADARHRAAVRPLRGAGRGLVPRGRRAGRLPYTIAELCLLVPLRRSGGAAPPHHHGLVVRVRRLGEPGRVFPAGRGQAGLRRPAPRAAPALVATRTGPARHRDRLDARASPGHGRGPGRGGPAQPDVRVRSGASGATRPTTWWPSAASWPSCSWSSGASCTCASCTRT